MKTVFPAMATGLPKLHEIGSKYPPPEDLIQKVINVHEGKGNTDVKNSTIVAHNIISLINLNFTEYKLAVSYSIEENKETHSKIYIVKKEQELQGNMKKSILQKEVSVYNILLQEFQNQSPHSQKCKLQSKRQLFLSKELHPNPNPWNPVIFLGKKDAFQYLFLKSFDDYSPVADESKELDFNHSLVALESLARFHANSYFLKKQMAKSQGKTSVSSLQLLNKFPFAEESMFTSENSRLMSRLYEGCYELVCKVTEMENPSLGMKLRRKIQGAAVFDKLKTLLENEKYENSDLYVFCHGNFSLGNLLFKYNNLNDAAAEKEPSECKIINYEFLRYAPLASDLAFFFACYTDGQLKKDFQEKLIAHYCDTFENELVEKLGFSPNEFDIEEFHRKVEEQFYGRMMEFGFLSSCLVLPLLSLKNSESNFSCLSINDENISQVIAQLKENILRNTKLQARILDNVKQIIKRGLL